MDAAAVWVTADFGPYGRRRDGAVERALARDGHSEGLPPVPSTGAVLPAPGEGAAHARLAQALAMVDAYARERNRVDRDGTTRLSPYLKAGCLHPRHRLWHQPEPERWPAGAPGLDVDTGAAADDRFRAWTEGRTGYPLVDAGMRQLVAEGWMHNRPAWPTASFLVKDLHLDWRRGAAWYLRHLVDGDLASNTVNWQWVAGAHASPWHRVFNPTRQARGHDPLGDYVRRWVPELDAPAYPEPIVDHAAERREALARRDRARGSGPRE